MITALREALDRPDLPVLIGGLGDFLADFNSPIIPLYYKEINSVLCQLGEECPDCAFVPATGLSSNPDNLHFSAAALKEFGIRYYKAFTSLEKEDRAEDVVTANTERTALEQL
jgi:hypothetical protein